MLGESTGLLTLAALCAAGEGTRDVPPELGRVAWERDHDAAFTRAASSRRPVLLLFQEIPG